MVERTRNPRESGVALILAMVLMIGLLAFTAVSVDLMKTEATFIRSEERLFAAKQIVESGLAQGIARLTEGGQTAPVSGNGTVPVWVAFADGQYYYSSDFDTATGLATITSWGRVPVGTSMSNCTVSPDQAGWDGDGYLVQGFEVTIHSSRYVPKSPMYFGNGGIEKPLGGFEWDDDADAFDPTTWETVKSSPSSYQSASIPLKVNALDHPTDYLTAGGSPTPAAPGVHPYNPMVSQNPIGQMNALAWFNKSANGGSAMSSVTPAPLTSFSNDPTSPEYAFPIDTHVADVQDFSWNLWSRFKDDANATKLTGGSKTGTYGSLAAPKVTFVTGTLRVDAGKSFAGTGILVVRDDFDPNVDTNNQPSTKAGLDIRGNFKWTGLVIVAGWAPSITVASGADTTIVGSLMGEDSVMSGGEISLDSATISLVVQGPTRLLYDYDMFQPGGLIYDYLPMLRKEVISARERFPEN